MAFYAGEQHRMGSAMGSALDSVVQQSRAGKEGVGQQQDPTLSFTQGMTVRPYMV